MAFMYNADVLSSSDTWASTLSTLQNQRFYLEDLLSKTATTLNALRDKQSRNERVLNANPSPRSKKKRIAQSRWRTGKTIKTCENEERVIHDCLQVCHNNITTLQTMMDPYSSACSTVTDIVTPVTLVSATPTDKDLGWNGWCEEVGLSPFDKDPQTFAANMEEIAPEVMLGGLMIQNLPLRNASLLVPDLTEVPFAPPNTSAIPPEQCERSQSMLRPEAAAFQPKILRHSWADSSPKLDKLTLSGLLSSQIYQTNQKRGFSDAALNHVVHRLSTESQRARKYASWSPE